MNVDPVRPVPTLLATCLLALVLGSVHGFSVFLVTLEADFGVSRSQSSLTYSFALVFLTLAVLYGHRFYTVLKPHMFAVAVCALATFGTLVAAIAPSLAFVWLGYSLVFGTANGLGYGYTLQLGGQAMPDNRGLAMGLVTAAYGVGAATSPIFFTSAMAFGGFSAAMVALAAALLATGTVTALLLASANAHFKMAKEEDAPAHRSDFMHIILFWIAYGAAVTSGLMAIGHAAPIALSTGLETPTAALAPVLISAFGIPGAILGGAMVDKVKPRAILIMLPILSAIALFIASSTTKLTILFGCLSVIGFVYGSIIAIYPAVISRSFGAINGIRVYGRVFTAWGTAGLAAPWFAGVLFDLKGNYEWALLTAAAIALLSSLTALTLKTRTS